MCYVSNVRAQDLVGNLHGMQPLVMFYKLNLLSEVFRLELMLDFFCFVFVESYLT